LKWSLGAVVELRLVFGWRLVLKKLVNEASKKKKVMTSEGLQAWGKKKGKKQEGCFRAQKPGAVAAEGGPEKFCFTSLTKYRGKFLKWLAGETKKKRGLKENLSITAERHKKAEIKFEFPPLFLGKDRGRGMERIEGKKEGFQEQGQRK